MDTMSDKEKRMISDSGYEVRQSFRIGGKEILLGERRGDDGNMNYIVCDYKEQGIFGEYSHGLGDDNYLEAVKEFTGRITAEAERIQAERDTRGLPADLFTAEHCRPNDYYQSIEGKVVAIKAEVFSPEYQSGDNQLVYVVRGNGAAANPRGNAVYCYHLNTGEHTRFERYEVQGEVRELPGWAKESLARIQAQMDKPAAAKEYAGNYEIIERMEVGQKVFALGRCERAVNPYGTWQGRKNSANSFDAGHYFNDYESAKTDLHDRAAKEQERIDRPKRREEGAR
jgi:hypothetical protein